MQHTSSICETCGIDKQSEDSTHENHGNICQLLYRMGFVYFGWEFNVNLKMEEGRKAHVDSLLGYMSVVYVRYPSPNGDYSMVYVKKWIDDFHAAWKEVQYGYVLSSNVNKIRFHNVVLVPMLYTMKMIAKGDESEYEYLETLIRLGGVEALDTEYKNRLVEHNAK